MTEHGIKDFKPFQVWDAKEGCPTDDYVMLVLEDYEVAVSGSQELAEREKASNCDQLAREVLTSHQLLKRQRSLYVDLLKVN